MAYQNVGTPRFYVSHPLWALASGSDEFVSGGNWSITNQKQYININPTKFKTTSGDYYHSFDYPDNGFGFNFFMFLGHKFSSDYDNNIIHILEYGTQTNLGDYDFFVNSQISGGQQAPPPYNGWSLMGYDTSPTLDGFRIKFTQPISCGSILWGKYYDMPHSPDLNLALTREYGGTKTIETKGGSSLSNTFYTKPAKWGNASAWELWNNQGHITEMAYSRNGRRVWDLSFSYLQDSDVFPVLSTNTPYESISPDKVSYSTAYETEDDISDDWWIDNSVYQANTFYSQVIHKTNGGQLPFVFQPDNSNRNPDQFAICKFDMDSFKFEQVANGVYNMQLKIREVW